MAKLNLNDLQYFLALSRIGTMSGAGKKLNVKHTTVARRISALEESLGNRLFFSNKNGYQLTQSGENLLEYAIRIEEQALEAQRNIFGQDALVEGVLKVTCPYDFFCRILSPHLPEFMAAYPKIELEFICSPAILDLSALEADIAVRITEKPPENLIGTQVLPLRHGVYASDSYLKEKHVPDQLILWRSEQSAPEWAKTHFPNAQISARTDEAETMLAMVKNHMGLARLPCYLAESIQGISRLGLPLKPSSWGIWILNHQDLRDTQRVRVFKEFLLRIIKQQSRTILGPT